MNCFKFSRMVCASLFVAISSAAAVDYEQYIEDVKNNYIPQVQAEAQAREAEVQQQAQSWVADQEEGSWASGNPAVDVLLDIETDWLQEAQTLSCNLSDVSNGFTTHMHSYDDLHTRFRITTNSGQLMDCDINIFFEYDPDDSGIEAGECLIPIYIPYFNIWICIWSHVVDYYFPTMKVNFSSQLFYSRYLPLEDLLEHFIEFKLLMETISGLYITQTMLEIYQFMNVPPWLWQVSLQGPELVDNPTNAWLRGGDREIGRSMMMGEEEIADDHKWWQPHRRKDQPFFATDFNSRNLLYFLHESEDRNEQMYEDFLDNGHEPCVRNNVASGKTPDFPEQHINSGWTGQYAASGNSRGGIENMPCLKNVGEVSIFTKHRRPHTSDGFWQSIIKGMKDYFIEYSTRSRYTFRQDIDRLHYLPEALNLDQLQRNDEFQQSIDKGTHGVFNCPLINRDSEGGDMVNRDYFEANSIDDRKANEETTAEIFTAFSGCWSPLPQRAWPIIYRWLPSVHGIWRNIRIE